MYEASKVTDANGVVTAGWGNITDIQFDKTDMMAYTGPYLLTYLEDSVAYRLVKNPNWSQILQFLSTMHLIKLNTQL